MRAAGRKAKMPAAGELEEGEVSESGTAAKRTRVGPSSSAPWG